MPSYNVLEHREDWYPIEGFPAYFITKRGEVISCYSTFPKVLKPAINHDGYYVVSMFDSSGKRKTMKLHRLLALTFIENPKPEEYNIVRHLDDNKKNISLENLEWGTYKLNYEDAVKNGEGHNLKRIGREKGHKTIKEKYGRKVKCYNIVYDSINEASKKLDINPGTIYKKLKSKNDKDFEFI